MNFAQFKLNEARTLFCFLLLVALAAPANADLGQFSTTPNLIGRGAIKSGGPSKDGIPALTNPRVVSTQHVSFLKSDDMIIGLNIDGETRAYPIRILVWHEIVNDTVGDIPVLISYCPLCYSSLVFNRDIGGEVREFGVSGLLYNSNVLMYDRQPFNLNASLWSQAEMRAVTGPAAKERLTLELIPFELTTWEDWRIRYPDTKVLSDDTGHLRSYNGDAYESYFVSERLIFPAKAKTQKPTRFKKKEPMIVVYTTGHARAYAFKDVVTAGGHDGVIIDSVGGRRIALIAVGDGASVRVEPVDTGGALKVSYQFWFSISASDPDVEIFDPDEYITR